jgi:hypothetical protein
MGANEAQNVAAIQRGFEAFAKGDIETLKTSFQSTRTGIRLKSVFCGETIEVFRPFWSSSVSSLMKPRARCAWRS